MFPQKHACFREFRIGDVVASVDSMGLQDGVDEDAGLPQRGLYHRWTKESRLERKQSVWVPRHPNHVQETACVCVLGAI